MDLKHSEMHVRLRTHHVFWLSVKICSLRVTKKHRGSRNRANVVLFTLPLPYCSLWLCQENFWRYFDRYTRRSQKTSCVLSLTLSVSIIEKKKSFPIFSRIEPAIFTKEVQSLQKGLKTCL